MEVGGVREGLGCGKNCAGLVCAASWIGGCWGDVGGGLGDAQTPFTVASFVLTLGAGKSWLSSFLLIYRLGKD